MNTHLFLSLVFSQNKQFGKNLAAGELLSNSHPYSLCPQGGWSCVQGLGDEAIGPQMPSLPLAFLLVSL